MTAHEHLRWAADRSLEYYDQGDTAGAMASFLSDVGKHDGTAHIQTHPATMFILEMNINRDRRAWEEAMLGFAVIETASTN